MEIYWSTFNISMKDSHYYGKWGAVSIIYNQDKSGAIIVGETNDVKFLDTKEEAELYCTQILKPYYHAIDSGYNLVYVEPNSDLFNDLYNKWEFMQNFLMEICEFANEYHESGWLKQQYMKLKIKIKGWFNTTP